MYICDGCGESPPPTTHCNKVVVEKVKYLHPERPKAKKVVAIQKNGKKKKIWISDPGGWGYQIVKEANLCSFCASRFGFEVKKSTVTA